MMATQREVDAGLEVMNEFIRDYVPAMFQNMITEDMKFNFVLAVLEAAEKVRKK